jgi:hypothetical protein
MDERIKLLLDLGHSAEDAERVVGALDHLEAATKRAGGGAAGMGQSFLQSGRVIQDFAQGGLPGILNNIEGLTVALGLGTGLAGILTIVGVAAYTAGPAIKDFFGRLIDGSNEVPESKDRLHELNDQLKDMAKELDGLKQKQSLTNTELARFTELTINQNSAQAEANRLKKEEDTIEKLRRTRTEEQKEIGGLVSEFIGADVEQVISTATAEVTGRAEAKGGRIRQLTDYIAYATARLRSRKHPPANPEALRKRLEDAKFELEDERRAIAAGVRADVAGAAQGDVGALGRLIGALPPGAMRGGLEGITPEAMRAQEAELGEWDDFAERARAGVRRRKADEKLQQKIKHDRAVNEKATERENDEEVRKIKQFHDEVNRAMRPKPLPISREQQRMRGLIGPGTTAEEFQHMVVENQRVMAENEMNAARLLAQLKGINKRLEEVPNAQGGLGN